MNKFLLTNFLSLMDIHYSNIFRACQKKKKGEALKKKGGQPVLSEKEEAAIVKCIIASCVWGYPIDLFDLRMIINSYLEDSGKIIKQFKNNIPGVDFIYSFVKRHECAISNLMGLNIKRSRAMVCDTEQRDIFYFDETPL